MNRLSLLLTSTVAVLGFSCIGNLAIAQENRYVEVGEDSSGRLVRVDLTSITQNRYGGYVYALRMTGGEVWLRVACRERRLRATRVVFNRSSGELTSDTPYGDDLSASPPDSPAKKSMQLVCKKIGASGY